MNNQLTYTHDTAIGQNGYGVSIGIKTEKLFATIIKQQQNIVLNGSMGFTDNRETLHGMHIVLEALCTVNGLTIIAGGHATGVATVSYTHLPFIWTSPSPA